MAVSSFVNTAVTQFIDYAFVVCIFALVYYVIKFILHDPDGQRAARRSEREEAENQRVSNMRDWFSRKRDEGRANAEQQARARELQPIRGWVLRADDRAVRARDELIRRRPSDAARHVTSLTSNISSARRQLNRLRHHFTDADRDWVTQLLAYLDTIEDTVVRDVEPNIPANDSDPDYDTKVRTLTGQLDNVAARCGIIIRSIDDYIRDGSHNDPAAGGAPGGAGRGPRPRPTPRRGGGGRGGGGRRGPRPPRS